MSAEDDLRARLAAVMSNSPMPVVDGTPTPDGTADHQRCSGPSNIKPKS